MLCKSNYFFRAEIQKVKANNQLQEPVVDLDYLNKLFPIALKIYFFPQQNDHSLDLES